MKARFILLLLLLPLLLGVDGNGCKTDYVLWVHGYEGTESHDLQKFESAIWRFREQGWKKPMYVISYYHGDKSWTNPGLLAGRLDLNEGGPKHCAHKNHFNSSDAHEDGAGCGGEKAHNKETRIEHLGYHLAWEIYNRFTSEGKSVRIMAHSMGGLITRYALQQVSLGNPLFPAYIDVKAVATFGTPHGGSDATIHCVTIPITGHTPCDTQMTQMKRGSGFLLNLESYRSNYLPSNHYVGYTRWTLYGSTHDDLVSVESALKPKGGGKIKYTGSPSIEHGDYFKKVNTSRDYDCSEYPYGTVRTNCFSTMLSAAMQLALH